MLSFIATCIVLLLLSFSVRPSILKITYPFTTLVGSFLSLICTFIVSVWSTSMLVFVVMFSVACLCLMFSSGVLLVFP